MIKMKSDDKKVKINQTVTANGKPDEPSKSRKEKKTGIEEEKSESIPVFVCMDKNRRRRIIPTLTDHIRRIKLIENERAGTEDGADLGTRKSRDGMA